MKRWLSLLLALTMLLAMASTASAAEITDLNTYETTNQEMQHFNIFYSQSKTELDVLSNCIDGLLTNDSHGNLVANSAKEWYSEDGGKTWTFILADGQTWFDKDGNYKADVVAEDWLYGLEWVLNFAKNDAVNTSMPIEMIQGAKEYYQYTKELYETDPEACMNLGLDKFKEMVGVSAPDDKTLIYTCVDKLAYFPTLATYSCLYPLSGKLLETGCGRLQGCYLGNPVVQWPLHHYQLCAGQRKGADRFSQLLERGEREALQHHYHQDGGGR